MWLQKQVAKLKKQARGWSKIRFGPFYSTLSGAALQESGSESEGLGPGSEEDLEQPVHFSSSVCYT